MPRNQDELGTPRDWLARARSNLARAKQPKPEEVLWEDLCFDAQQAVEKSIKALLLAKGITFRFVHDVGELLNLLAKNGVQIPAEILESAELTEFAVEARYPGPFEPVTEDEAARAIEIAERVVNWVSSLIEG
jgi:HEPN domain-containing protein